jgi:hypothetical protein
MTDAEYTADMGAADVPATMESVAIVETVRAIAEKDRTDEQKADLFRNEGHIVIKMKWTEFVKALSTSQKAKIDALSL